jgi:hypothetical protein
LAKKKVGNSFHDSKHQALTICLTPYLKLIIEELNRVGVWAVIVIKLDRCVISIKGI